MSAETILPIAPGGVGDFLRKAKTQLRIVGNERRLLESRRKKRAADEEFEADRQVRDRNKRAGRSGTILASLLPEDRPGASLLGGGS